MQAPPDRVEEAATLSALLALDILDTEPEIEFDALVRAASIICDAPISLITLIDADRQWFKANVGLPSVSETPRNLSFCAYAVLEDGLFEVNDASSDARFQDNPLVTGEPDIKFYAGAPLTLRGGRRIGTLCVFDRKPRKLTTRQRESLLLLSKAATQALEGRAALQKQTEISRLNARAAFVLTRTGELAGVGGWEVDLSSGKILWSEEVCRIHGCPMGHSPSLDEALGFYTVESRPRVQKAVELAMAGGAGFDLEIQITRTDGQLRWIRTVGSVDFVADSPVRLVGAMQDVTERHRLSVELAEQHELLRVTLQSIGDAVITTDTEGNITWLNPVAERMTGWLASEAMGRPLDQVFHIVDNTTKTPAENPILACIKHDKVMGLAANTLLISRNGEEFGVQDSASPIRNDQGEMLGAVLVFHDVTEQRRITGEMSYRARHDALTGLVNRLEFETQLDRLLAKSRQNGSVHALMYIDLDQFKLVNDACGHAAGDLLLQNVSRLLEDVIRGRDTLGRLGGDEFAVLLERCTTEQAQRVAQQICDRMDEFRFVHDGKRFRIGTSIGLVPVDARWTSTSAIMQAADTSCYAAKEAGRNRVHAWVDTDAALQARSGDMKWATRLEQALDENRFVLFAQRIFPLTGDKSKLSAEVLVRMLDTDGSLIPPSAFLPAAERFTLSSRIDQWVLRRSIDALKMQPHLDRLACLSINLSGQSVGDRAFHRKALAILKEAGPAICGKVFFEITETAAITNMADASRFIELAHGLNIGIALDDFGAGAASFGYLKSLKADKLKIDGQFIRDVIVDPLDNATVRCFVEVAKLVNMKTVAEFVDSAAVLEKITEMGVDYAQGYHLHRPEPIQNVLNMVEQLATLPAIGNDC